MWRSNTDGFIAGWCDVCVANDDGRCNCEIVGGVMMEKYVRIEELRETVRAEFKKAEAKAKGAMTNGEWNNMKNHAQQARYYACMLVALEEEHEFISQQYFYDLNWQLNSSISTMDEVSESYDFAMAKLNGLVEG